MKNRLNYAYLHLLALSSRVNVIVTIPDVGIKYQIMNRKSIAVFIRVRTVLLAQSLEATGFILSTQHSALSTLL